MIKANRFLKYWQGFFLLLFLSLSLLSVSASVLAEGSETKAEQKFSLEVTDNLIDLQANQTSFKEILHELEKKTGIKVNIFDGVDDKKVTLDIKALPVYAIHTLLEKIGLENFAVVYDKELASKVIYTLPEGKDIAEVIKGKEIIGLSYIYELSKPTADTTDIDNLVPEIFARRIVTFKAKEKWGKIAVGQPIYCSDDNGKLVAYMVPVKIDADEFPNDDILLSWMKLKTDNEERAFNWGTGDYWTFVVSARESDFPIPTYFNTLPPYYVTAAEAAKVAKQTLNVPTVKLNKYYFLGHRGEYFEFSYKNEVILVDAYCIS